MTYSITITSQSLICPSRLTPASMLLKDREIVPAEPGIYAWWFRAELPDVPMQGTKEKDGYRLLYVGIAPRRPSRTSGKSRSNLRERIMRNHLGNSSGRSTLRRSLACLLAKQMRFKAVRSPAGRMRLPPEQERALTGWLGNNAALSWLPFSTPWILEDYLLETGPALPLNIKGSKLGFGSQLSALRVQLFNRVDCRSESCRDVNAAGSFDRNHRQADERMGILPRH